VSAVVEQSKQAGGCPRGPEQGAGERVRTVRTRQAAEEVSAVVEQSKQQVAALVYHSREQVNDYVGRTRQARRRG